MTGPSSRGMDRRAFLGWMAAAGGFAANGTWVKKLEAAAPTEVTRMWRAMGTLLDVTVCDLPEADGVAAIGEARRAVEDVEQALTLYRRTSPLVALNRSPEGAWVRDRELAEAVRLAQHEHRVSEGRFDPTVGPRLRALGLTNGLGTTQTAAVWRALPGPDAVETDGFDRVRRLDRRVEFDFGGIGKGIAVDRVLEILRAAGSGCALINFGTSHIAALNPPEDARHRWGLAIQDPEDPNGFLTSYSIHGGHLSTSGVTDKQLTSGRGREHHLIDPRSGEPAKGVLQVCVRAPEGVSGAVADARSTAVLVEVAEQGGIPGDALVVPEDGDWECGQQFVDWQ